MFPAALAHGLTTNRLSRRHALWLMGASTSATTLAVLQGCAQSPVTGQNIVVGMSEAQERQIDSQVSPHQFSQDLGAVQDAGVNRYVSELGQRLHSLTHRPQMPYSYRVLNAHHINAYTFPGGAMGVTRGIMVEMQSEAELAALLGHELGHVNARHAAQRSGQTLLAQAAVVGIQAATAKSEWATVAEIGSQIGSSALLSSYSRDHEREADALGQGYMVRAGYPASGMTRLHQLLVNGEKDRPNVLAAMFSSHPMSEERVANAQRLAATQFASSGAAPDLRERYMDQTAALRRLKPAITACQQGETAMGRRQPQEAQGRFEAALKAAPRDYAANLRMAQCLQALGRPQQARPYAQTAQAIYPQEAQAHKLSGVLALSLKDPGAAAQHLAAFDQRLPGDPGVTFLQGVAQEGLGNRPQAAAFYQRFLQTVRQGEAAQYSATRLRTWGLMP